MYTCTVEISRLDEFQAVPETRTGTGTGTGTTLGGKLPYTVPINKRSISVVLAFLLSFSHRSINVVVISFIFSIADCVYGGV